MKNLLVMALCGALLLGGGCGTLIPKRVEFFQDKVQKFPEESASYREAQRRAAALAERRVQQVLEGAIEENCTTNVTQKAEEARRLTGAVADSLGNPLKPATDASSAADALRKAMAKLDQKIESFKQSNDENAGKKIEGTGLFSVPYFVWLFIVILLVFAGLVVAGLVWTALKVYATTNPPLALGLNAVQAGGNFAKKALAQVLKGGEEFKSAVMKEVNDPAVQARLQQLFSTHQRINQDQDVQAVVKELTKKE
jgi:hypothetical protein